MLNEWDGLEEAVAIADAGSFHRAAANLRISTSQISRVIARLEHKLETQLFYRTTRSVSLTDTGRAFVERSRQIIGERDELLSLVHGTGEPHGQLRVTCATAVGERFVAPILRRFAARHSRLRVTLDLTNRVVDLVGEGYDLGIRTGQVSDARLVGRELARRDVELCASPEYLAQAREPRTIGDLAEQECLVGTSATWRFLVDGEEQTYVPDARWRCNSGSAVADAAISGMGICQLPRFYVGKHIAAGQLMPIMTRYRPLSEAIWAVYPARHHLTPKVRNFTDTLLENLQIAIDSA